MNKYVKMMRLDHWIKQLFILPGICFAILLTKYGGGGYDCLLDKQFLITLIQGFLATCLIASANYEINEFLDREFDRFHPLKKVRTAASEVVNGLVVWTIWLVLSVIGLLLSFCINKLFFFTNLTLLLMGIVYNVKPIRTKDVPYLDVLSESVNNALRFLLGWFIVTDQALPPCSIVLGYWMSGSYLMATKRFSEYRMIANPQTAGLYRKSFKFYTEKSLLISSFFYAMSSVFFVGIFLIKYKIELLLFVPFLIGLFCFYFRIAFNEDSAAQRPEKLFKEKGLMVYCLLLVFIFLFLLKVEIPFLDVFTSNDLVLVGN